VGRELAWPTLLVLQAAYFGSTEAVWATLNSMNGVVTLEKGDSGSISEGVAASS
jgi:hypothetical protein